MKYSFNVFCDSTIFFSQVNGSTTSYWFDWSVVPNKNYDLTFSYMSDDTTTTLSPIMTLAVDFNSAENSYLANGGNSRRVNTLGVLKADKHGANAFYYADSQLNPPVRLQRPSNNVFTVTLNNGLSGVPYSTPVATPYVLILHFEECDDY